MRMLISYECILLAVLILGIMVISIINRNLMMKLYETIMLRHQTVLGKIINNKIVDMYIGGGNSILLYSSNRITFDYITDIQSNTKLKDVTTSYYILYGDLGYVHGLFFPIKLSKMNLEFMKRNFMNAYMKDSFEFIPHSIIVNFNRTKRYKKDASDIEYSVFHNVYSIRSLHNGARIVNVELLLTGTQYYLEGIYLLFPKIDEKSMSESRYETVIGEIIKNLLESFECSKTYEYPYRKEKDKLEGYDISIQNNGGFDMFLEQLEANNCEKCMEIGSEIETVVYTTFSEHIINL